MIYRSAAKMRTVCGVLSGLEKKESGRGRVGGEDEVADEELRYRQPPQRHIRPPPRGRSPYQARARDRRSVAADRVH